MLRVHLFVFKVVQKYVQAAPFSSSKWLVYTLPRKIIKLHHTLTQIIPSRWFLFQSICRVEIMFFNTKLHFFWRMIWHSLLRTNLKNRREWSWDSKSAASKDLIYYQQRHKSLWQFQKKNSLFNQCQNIKWWLQLKGTALGTTKCRAGSDTPLIPLHGYKQPLDCKWDRKTDVFILQTNASHYWNVYWLVHPMCENECLPHRHL